MAGRQPNLVGYYSGWAEPFNRSFAELVHRHRRDSFVQIDPTFGTVSAIAAGTYDEVTCARTRIASATSAIQ